MTHDVGLYLTAVFDHWLSAWGGVVLMVIAMVEAARDKKTPKRLFFSAAVVCLVIAMFLAWQDEDRNSQDKDRQIQALQVQIDALQKPDISGEFIFFSAFPSGDEGQDSIASFQLYLTNNGAPTALDDFGFTLRHLGKDYKGEFLPVPTGRIVLLAGRDKSKGGVVLSPESNIFLAVGQDPIPRNGARSVWGQVLLKGITPNDVVQKSNISSLSFEDIASHNKHVLTHFSAGMRAELPDWQTLERQSRR